jgi:hypothetical protein
VLACVFGGTLAVALLKVFETGSRRSASLETL